MIFLRKSLAMISAKTAFPDIVTIVETYLKLSGRDSKDLF